MLANNYKTKSVGLLITLLGITSTANAINFGRYDVIGGTFTMRDPGGGIVDSVKTLTSTGGQLIDHTYKSIDTYQGNSSTPGTVVDNFTFFGSPVTTYTANTGVDSGNHPAVRIDVGNLTADMSSFYAYWNTNEFNQGSKTSPPPGDTDSTPVTVTDNGDGTFNLSWVSKIIGAPFDQFVGFWSVNIQCASSYICSNNAPTAVNDSISTDFNTASSSFNLTANDTDSDTHTGSAIDATTVTISSSSGSVTGTTGIGSGTQTLALTNGTVVLNESNGTVVYTPNTGATGSENFFYTVQDELGQDSENDFGATSNYAQVTVTINAAGQPNAASDSASTAFATAVDIDVDANDVATQGGASILPGSVIISSAPSNGSAVANTPVAGSVRYTPNASFFGIDTFQYTITDDVPTTSNAATVTVTVASPPRSSQPTDQTSGATPEVTIAQGSNTNTRTILTTGGNFTVTVDTSGGLYDRYSWTGTSTEVVGDQSVTPPTLGGLSVHWTETSNSITVDPSGLTAGNHLIKVKMWDIDATPSAGTTVDIVVTVVSSGTLSDFADSDNDGILDANDNNALGVTELQTEVVGTTTYVMQTSSGQLGLGTSARCASKNGAVILLSEFNQYDTNNNCVASTGTTDNTVTVQTGVGGYFDFEVRGLTAGETISVAIPLSVNIPINAGYRKFNDQDKWTEFKTSSTEYISSANQVSAGTCPSPTSSTAWTRGLNEGHNCMLITLTDGGDNDADGKPNGIVVDPGAIESYPGFNSNDVTVSGGGWWLLMGFPALFGIRRLVKK